MSAYAGYGQGDVRFESETIFHESKPAGTIGIYAADLRRMWFQPGLYYNDRGVEIAFVARVARMQYGNTWHRGFDQGDLDWMKVEGIEDAAHWMVEPAATLRVGYDWLKIYGQAGLSFQVTANELPYDGIILSLGAQLRWARRYRKKFRDQE